MTTILNNSRNFKTCWLCHTFSKREP